jgi:hypothetical protein
MIIKKIGDRNWELWDHSVLLLWGHLHLLATFIDSKSTEAGYLTTAAIWKIFGRVVGLVGGIILRFCYGVICTY